MPVFRILLLAVAAFATSPAARAAQSYDNCAGFIDSLPATLTTQGTWCLRKDLSTAITAGAAITIDANNITIDCNDFKLGGLAAGPASNAVGIAANGRINATVRNCAVRGFNYGIRLYSGASHLVEDNRLDNNLFSGISVEGDGSVIRRNRVLDTGGKLYPSGIMGGGAVDIEDNTVSNVVAPGASDSYAVGISAHHTSNARVVRNTVRGLTPGLQEGANVVGILVEPASRALIRDNHLFGTGLPGTGVLCSEAGSRVGANTIQHFEQAFFNCADAGGNDISP